MSYFVQEKYLVDVIKVEDVITAMRFGRFGREDGALIMITQSRSSLMAMFLIIYYTYMKII